jgi:hypothetical protein
MKLSLRTRTRLFALGTLLALVPTPGCQCSDKPDIGPVEDDDASAAVVVVEQMA